MTLPKRVALGTMHGKAAVIAPPLVQLGIVVEVPKGLDTDRFGTFTGEVARLGTMEQAARAKARAAVEATGLPVGIASEGAYGPHPAVPFLAIGQELILWHEAATGREVVELLRDDRPVYDQALVSSVEEVKGFLSRIAFPTVAVVVAGEAAARPLAKGLTDTRSVARAVAEALALSDSGRALVTTDMRAHLNPRRMSVIGDLAQRLAARLACPCPACAAPGWGRLRVEAGLPCSDCGTPTGLIRTEILGCTACGAEAAQPFPGAPIFADPGQCPICNP